MTRWERFGTRDLSFSHWHRAVMDDDCDVIDVDWCEYCHYCKEPLALLELAQDIGQSNKVAYVTEKLAKRAELRGMIVLYHLDDFGSIDYFRVRRLVPRLDSHYVRMTPERFAGVLREFRYSHKCPGSLKRAWTMGPHREGSAS